MGSQQGLNVADDALVWSYCCTEGEDKINVNINIVSRLIKWKNVGCDFG